MKWLKVHLLVGKDGLSCAIWRRAELFQQEADVRLKPAALNSMIDAKSMVFIRCEAKNVCAQAVFFMLFMYNVFNAQQMEASI